jgi:3-deoxy-D-manno-octulosonic-acid transferase
VADYVFYLPLDSQSNAEHFFSSLKIKLAFFVKYEIWYHYLKTLKEFSIPVFLISANIRPDHVYVKWYGTFFKDMLRLFNHIFSQNETSNRLLQEQHFTHISVSKDTRFDRVWENSNQVKQFPFIQQFIQDSKVLIIGSSYAEEETLVEACMECLQDWKIIIAPHHIENRRITEITDCFASHGVTTYSELLNNIPTKDTRVLVIDNVGMLASIYRYGSIAFIGGGYGKSGLHNTLEAAVFGMPVLFGPNNLRKFPESLDMVNAGVGFVINDAEVLKKHLLLWTHYPEQLADIALKARNFVTSQTGATQHIFDYLYAHKLL